MNEDGAYGLRRLRRESEMKKGRLSALALSEVIIEES